MWHVNQLSINETKMYTGILYFQFQVTKQASLNSIHEIGAFHL